MASAEGPSYRAETKTNPDPSEATNVALEAAIKGLHELLDTRIDGEILSIKTRFDAMDKAVELLQAFANKSPTIDVVEEHVVSLKEVMEQRFQIVNEKLKAVDDLFAERALATIKAAADVKSAVDAAFAAQKELVNGAFAAMKEFVNATFAAQKEIMVGNQQITTKAIEGVTTTVTDLKDRIVSIESRGQGQQSATQSNMGAISLIVSVVVAVSIVVGTFVHLAK
jgi:hypothetical protein